MSRSSPDVPYQPQESLESTVDSSETGGDATVLQAAVRTTIETAEIDARSPNEEIEALRMVARRYEPGPLVLEPTAIELVRAVINVNYGQLNRTPEVWRGIAVKIATVLFDAPAARSRLENLWHRLQESNGPSA